MLNFLTANNTPNFGSWGTVLIIIVMLVVLYFMMIRPQKKQEKETKNMLDNLAIGDEIVTIGGIVGVIVNISGDETITIISSREHTRIQLLKSAVSRVQVSAASTEEGKEDQPTEKK